MRLALAALLVVALGARAEEKKGAPEAARARTLYEEARTELAQGRCEEAVPKLWEAYRLAPVPNALLHIGYCCRILGQYAKASDAYLKYLTAYPNREDVDHVRDLLAQVDAEERRARRAKVEPHPVAPPPRIEPPKVAIAPPKPPAEPPPQQEAPKPVAVAKEEPKPAVVAKEEPKPVAVAKEAPKPVVVAKAEPVQRVAAPEPPVEKAPEAAVSVHSPQPPGAAETESGWQRPVGFAAILAAVVVGVTGYAEATASRSNVDAANAHAQANGGVYPQKDLAAIDSARTQNTVANVLVVAAGVLGLSGLALTFVF